MHIHVAKPDKDQLKPPYKVFKEEKKECDSHQQHCHSL